MGFAHRHGFHDWDGGGARVLNLGDDAGRLRGPRLCRLLWIAKDRCARWVEKPQRAGSSSAIHRRGPNVPANHERIGAGEGNRTLVFSLEGCCSTIELHPQFQCLKPLLSLSLARFWQPNQSDYFTGLRLVTQGITLQRAGNGVSPRCSLGETRPPSTFRQSVSEEKGNPGSIRVRLDSLFRNLRIVRNPILNFRLQNPAPHVECEGAPRTTATHAKGVIRRHTNESNRPKRTLQVTLSSRQQSMPRPLRARRAASHEQLQP